MVKRRGLLLVGGVSLWNCRQPKPNPTKSKLTRHLHRCANARRFRHDFTNPVGDPRLPAGGMGVNAGGHDRRRRAGQRSRARGE